MSKPMSKYKVRVGDWSDDGHGKCETIWFECSLTEVGLAEAFKLADSSLEEPFGSRLFSDYEDSLIPTGLLEELVSKGFEFGEGIEYDEYDDGYMIYGAESFVSFFLTVTAMFTPCEWALAEEDTAEVSFPSSGYGMFYN